MLKRTPKDVRREECQLLIKRLLSGKYLTLSLGPLAITEHIATGETEVSSQLSISNIEGLLGVYDINGTGMGFVDALFNGVCGEIVEDCKTFNNLSIEQFYVQVDSRELAEPHHRGVRGSAANVDICLILNNGYSTTSSAHVPFRSRSRSIISAGAQVVIHAVEFFVNSEKAVIELKHLVKNAEQRSRPDLVEKYIDMLSQLTANTSYEGI